MFALLPSPELMGLIYEKLIIENVLGQHDFQ